MTKMIFNLQIGRIPPYFGVKASPRMTAPSSARLRTERIVSVPSVLWGLKPRKGGAS